MLVSTIVVAALGVVAEQAVEIQFGLPGIIGLLILRTGIRHRNTNCACIGATVLVMLALHAV
ncbi:hypothetical protein [Streptomyces sp. 6N223]|uniref:hypothetical protein n=1 Tax=Streptomyces sp. 6N223 TaxID=3457412 RepID=UPI003FD395B6